MKLTKKKGISVILIILIILTLSSVYILRSGSESFAMLNIESVESVNDPALKTAIEATEECNNLKIGEKLKNWCYRAISSDLSRYYESFDCTKIKLGLRPPCYRGYGIRMVEQHNMNIKTVQDYCSKITPPQTCLEGAAVEIGEKSSKHIETEQCKEFEQKDVKQRCYDGLGRQLAKDNKESKLCEKTEDKESCLRGFAFKIDIKNREEALQICHELNDKTCYKLIGYNNYFVYHKNIKDSFKDCEQYPYPEECKIGVAEGAGFKFFKEKQQKNNEIFTPVMFTVYKTINPPATKVNLIIKGKIIPHLINHKSTYLVIIFFSLQLIVIVQLLKNKKVQNTIIKLIATLQSIVTKLKLTLKNLLTKLRTILQKLLTKQKQPQIFTEQETEITLPLKLFYDRTLSILEHITQHLKENYDLNYTKIAKLLNRSPKTVWTTCQRARKKRG